MHKYDITPPEDIYIDMECQGTENSPVQGVGHLIVYGIEGKQNDVGSDVFDSLYVVEKGKMVMQTDLDMNNHHVTGVLVDENDKKSVVSVGYFEEGFVKMRYKSYYDLFTSFIDFRTPDTYDLTDDGRQIYLSAKPKKGNGVIDINHNKFLFERYGGKKGLGLENLLNVNYPSLTPVDTHFVFVGVLKNDTGFSFVPNRLPALHFTMNAPFIEAKYIGKPVKQRLPDGFFDERVVFMAKFTRVGISCNITALENNNSHSFSFTQKGFTFLTVGFSPNHLNKIILQMEFFGLVEGGNLASLYRFLMEEKFRE